MKNKVFFLVMMLFFTSAHILSQTITIEKSQDYNSFFAKEPTKFLDKTSMLVTYRLEILQDTLNLNAISSANIMMLQIGTKYDKYFDLHKAKYKEFLTSDENTKKDPNIVINQAIQLGKGTLNEEIYWDYPEKRSLTVVDYMLGGYYLYQESIPQIRWKMEEGIETVANYVCKKAVCSLFGRNYIVWYTPDIPISKGPWKFSGLPGLILKITDDHNQISWTCIGLEKDEKNIFFTERDYIKTNKSKFLKSFNEYKRNPAAMMQSAGMIKTNKPKKTRAYNPIERE